MFKNYTFIILLIFLTTSFSLSAQTQAEMNEIAQNDFKKADAELNVLYKKVIKVLDNNEKILLEALTLNCS